MRLSWGGGHGRQGRQSRHARGQTACPMIILKNHWNQKFRQRQTEREITLKNITCKTIEKGWKLFFIMIHIFVVVVLTETVQVS